MLTYLYKASLIPISLGTIATISMSDIETGRWVAFLAMTAMLVLLFWVVREDDEE
jgi:hypothetical protein